MRNGAFFPVLLTNKLLIYQIMMRIRVDQLKNLNELKIILLQVSLMNCPVCGGEAKATGKEFKFGVFDGKSYKCESCGKPFNAFYKEGKFSHTVPKAK